MNKKYIVSIGLAATILIGAASLVVAEQDTQTQPQATMMPTAVGAKEMVLQVGPNGKVLLRGTVTEISGTTSLTVKSWGGLWVVNVSSATQVMPSTSISQFQVGDFVGVQGTVSQSASWTVDATLVRSWTERKMMKEEKQAMRTERHNNEQEIKDVIKSESPKNWQGTASNVNVDAKTFTLTVDGTAYTVALVADAKIVDKMFLSTDLAKVKDGDTVRVWGPVSGTTINAYVFRDVSIAPTYDLKKGTK